MKSQELERLFYLETKLYDRKDLSDQEAGEFERLFKSRVDEFIAACKL